MDIQNITIRYGFRSHHPFLQIAFGVLLSLLLIDMLGPIYHWLTHGGVMIDVALWMIIPGGLGVYLIVDAISRGYYLIIQMPRGRRKIAFDQSAKLEAIREFADLLRQRKFNVTVDAVL